MDLDLEKEYEKEVFYQADKSFFTKIKEFIGSERHKIALNYYRKCRPYRLKDDQQATGYYKATQIEVENHWLGRGIRVKTKVQNGQNIAWGSEPLYKGVIVETSDGFKEDSKWWRLFDSNLYFKGEVKVRFDRNHVLFQASRYGATTGKITHKYGASVAVNDGVADVGKTGKLVGTDSIMFRELDLAKE